MASLLYGINAKKGFIVITGEVGTGKTTLLRKLMRSLDATVRFVFIFNTYLNFDELLELILLDLGLAHKGKTRLMMIQELNEYLIQQLQKGRIVSLLIDEAQNLSDAALEGLRLLSNLETEKEKLLQIVLMGQPELENKLDQPSLRQLKQRVSLHYRLDCLKDREVYSYIDYRLRAAGYEGRDLFSPDALREIASSSKGIARLINIICDNALLAAYAGSQKRVSADMIREVSRDLRLRSEVQGAEVKAVTPKTTSNDDRHKANQAAPDEAAQRKSRRVARTGVGTLLVLLFLAGLASFVDPLQAKDRFRDLNLKVETLIGIAGERLGVLGHNLNKWLAVATSREAEAENVQAPFTSETSVDLAEALSDEEAFYPEEKEAIPLDEDPEPSSQPDARETTPPETSSPRRTPSASPSFSWRAHPILIKRGSTIRKIAADFYGASSIFLGMDLIKEFNPQITNLNRIYSGEGLWLPPFTRETLLRKEPDDPYRLILRSFSSSKRAEEFAWLVRYEGYPVVITPRRVSDNLLLHRVKIAGLKTLKAADQAWGTATANDWFPFSETVSLPGRRSIEQNLRGLEDR